MSIGDEESGGDCQLGMLLDDIKPPPVLPNLDLKALDLLIVENVGNLVCPAEFNMGEDHKVMILSVTEGDDKPEKYPLMFHESSVLLINKIDLLPYIDCDVGRIKQVSLRINPNLEIFEISCKTGEGIDQWINWLSTRNQLRG